MVKRTILGGAVLALAASFLAFTPTACGGGGGGGGLGIATVGVSAIFAGASPGWCVRDPGLATPVTGAGSLNVTPTAEDPIVIRPAEEIDRVIIAGGLVFPPVIFRGVATATANNTELKASLIFSSWDATRQFFEIATASALVNQAPTDFNLKLDFSKIKISDTVVMTNFQSNPGDQFVLRLSAVANTVTVDTRAIDAAGNLKTRVDYASGQTRGTLLKYDAAGNLTEDFREVQSPTTTSLQPFSIGAVGSASVVTGVNQTTLVRAEVRDQSGFGVPGVNVRFVAPGTGAPGATTVRTLQDGIATAALVWTVTGTSFSVTATALDVGGLPLNLAGTPASFSVEVRSTPVRNFDGLEGFTVSTSTGSGKPKIDVRAVLDTGELRGFDPAGKTTQPSTVTYTFARDATTGANWAFDLFCRTRSLLLTATATFEIKVFESNGGALLATSTAQVVTSGLQPVSGSMTQVRSLAVVANPGNLSPNNFDVTINVLASSDAGDPGIELIADRATGLISRLSFPGPVVTATTPSIPQGFLASAPDPRR